MQHIKTSHGIAVLGICFFASIFFINWASKQFDTIALYVPAGSQTAAVSDSNFTSRDSYGSGGGHVNFGYFWSGNDRWTAGAKFTAESSYTLTRINLPMSKAGKPSFNMRAHIYSDNNGIPGSNIGIPSLWISANQSGNLSFDSMNVSIVSGTIYWIILENDLVNGDGANYQTWTYTFDGGNGPFYIGSDGNSWNIVSNNTHMNFTTYSDGVGQVPSPSPTVQPTIAPPQETTTPSPIISNPPSSSSPVIDSGTIPSNRIIDWSQAGIPGGIPKRTTICATLSPLGNGADDTPRIQGAIDGCGYNQVVKLESGSFLVSSPIVMRSHRILRGSGQETVLISSFRSIYGTITFDSNAASMYWGKNIVNFADGTGATKGATSIKFGDGPGTISGAIAVGTKIQIQEDNEPGVIFGGIEGDSGNWAKGQWVEVTSIDHTNRVISFSPPLYSNYSSNLNPRIHHPIYGASGKQGNNFVEYAGVEDLKIINTNAYAYSNIMFGWSAYSWVKNVESQDAGISHVWTLSSFRSEIRDSYFHGIAPPITSSRGYGIQMGTPNSAAQPEKTTGMLIENNIFDSNRGHLFIGYGSAGNVVGYNYFINSIGGNSQHQGSDILFHSNYPIMNLVEGNVGYKGIVADNFHGNAGYNIILRNNFLCKSPGKTSSIFCVGLDVYQRNYSIVGNVFGYSGITSEIEQLTNPVGVSVYQRLSPEPIQYGNELKIFMFGYVGEGGGLHRTDPQVLTTLFRLGNYDYFHNCTWNDSLSRCLTGLEMQSLNFPDSLYLSNRPSWWPSSVIWPPIGPDVSGMVNKIPAQICFEQGKMPNCLSRNDVSPPPPSTPTISSISASSITSSGALISWSTTGTNSQVLYGLTTSYGSNTTSTSGSTQTLSGLSPNTVYYYKVRSTNSAGQSDSGDYTFTTLPTTPSPTPTPSVTPPPDTSAPTITISASSVTVPVGTRSTPLTLTTDEPSTCTWGTTPFTANGNTHTITIVNLIDGVNNIPISCRDTVGNIANTRVVITVTPSSLLPIATRFTIPDLTNKDLNSVPDFEVSNLLGRVRFTTPVKLIRNTTPLDLDSHLTITQNSISLDSTNLPELNRPATLTFYNVTISPARLKILKDGIICSTCTASYSGTTLTITVPGFSTYTILDEGDPVPPPVVVTPPLSPSGGGGSRKTTIIIAPVTPKIIPGCGSRTIGFSETSGVSCKGNVASASVGLYNFGTVTLRNGSRGPAVMELQRFLNAKLNLGLTVDGKLGPKTITVIKKWQRGNGLVADGLVGAKTKARMNGVTL